MEIFVVSLHKLLKKETVELTVILKRHDAHVTSL